MEEKFFNGEQLKVGELIEGYFIKSESEVNKRVRFLQRRLSQKESSVQKEVTCETSEKVKTEQGKRGRSMEQEG